MYALSIKENLTWNRKVQLLCFLCFLVVNSSFQSSTKEAKRAGSQSSPSNPPTPQPPLLRPEDPLPSPSVPSKSVPPELNQAIQEYQLQIERVIANYPGGSNRNSSLKNLRDYRGNFYEYFRNDILDALPHEVRQANGKKSILRRNQFGFSLTGPVKIPGIYDGRGKTFFSLIYEGTREKISRPFLADVPTSLQRVGDFSDLVDNAGQQIVIYDPNTTRANPNYDSSLPVSKSNLEYLRTAFPGNRIPVDRMDPVALEALSYYPYPNTNVGPFLRNNFFANGAETNTPNGTVLKFDHNLSYQQKLTWSGRISSGIDGPAPIFENPANPGDPKRKVRSRRGEFSHTVNISPNWINKFSVDSTYISLSVTDTLEEQFQTQFPIQLGLTGLHAGAFPRFDLAHLVDIGSRPRSLYSYRRARHRVSNSVSVSHKKHNVKFYGRMHWRQVNSFNAKNPSGRFNFSGQLTALPGINNTGNPFAQFLLGMADRAEQSIVLHPTYLRSEQYDFTVTDEYHLTPNVTWTFWLGAELKTARRENFDRQSSLDFNGLNPANGRPGILVFAGRNGRPRTFSPNQFNWEPGMGVALSPGGSRKNVIRANYALGSESFPLRTNGFASLGFNAEPLLISPNRQLEPALILRQGFPPVANPPNLSATAANDQRAGYFEPDVKLPSLHMWWLEIERDLSVFAIRLSYNGKRGTHLFMGAKIELNPIDPSFLRLRDKLNNLEFSQSLRPFPQFRSISSGHDYPAGSSSIHRGELRLDKRLSSGLSFTGAYSFSKSLDNIAERWFGPPQTSTNLQAEKAISSYDRTHRFRASYLYELPFGQGRRFSSSNTWINTLADGWRMSGMSIFRTGTPIQLRPLFNNTGRVAGSLRVNSIASVDPHVHKPSPFQWFNTAAFDQPPDFTLGDVSRNHPTLRNPGFWDLDMSLSKRVSLSEDWTLELFGEAFNALNHANLNKPDPVIGSIRNPNTNAGRIIGSSGGRIVQLGFRVSF